MCNEEEELVKVLYKAEIEGGVHALETLIDNLVEVNSKQDIEKLTMREVIDLLEMFKGEYTKLLDMPI